MDKKNHMSYLGVGSGYPRLLRQTSAYLKTIFCLNIPVANNKVEKE